VPALVEESRAAGMRAYCKIEVDGAEVPDAVGRTIYRIVQEGLTNARKHAPYAAVEVRVCGGDDAPIVVEVVNRDPVTTAPADDAPPGAGTGLVGLAERVELAGGELRHGRNEGGDFVLHAELPCRP